MLYGAETWGTTKNIEKKISSSDQRMLRHMAHVRWEDRVTSEEVRRRFGVDVISGVEKAPGVKDENRAQRFVQTVKQLRME